MTTLWIVSGTMPDSLVQDRFRILFDHSSDAHFIVDETGITDCNEATIKLLKCRSKTEVLSLHPAILSPEYQPDGRKSSEKSQEMDQIARKNGWHRFEWMHRKSDGEEFPVEVTLNSVEIGGRPALIAVWHDLTEAKRAERQLQKLNQRMTQELESAAEFQRSLLPSRGLNSDRFESAWFYKPCEELGGDSLHIFPVDETHVALYVLDVTGHGAASALLSVTATHFLSGIFKNHCPRSLVESINEHFCHENYKNHSFTLVYGILNLKDSSFVYTTAGHLGPILIRKDGQVCQLEGYGPPIGMVEGISYEEGRVDLRAGDRLFLISDGVYEARNAKNEDLGLAGVYSHLKKENINEYSLEYTVHSLARTAYHWCLPKKPDDDISIVGVQLK